MKKAIYIPTNTIIMIISNIGDTHVKVFLDGEEKTVPCLDIQYIDMLKSSTFNAMNQAIFSSLISSPVSDLLYSYNTNRLVPEHYQYRPLIKMLQSPNNRLLIADEVGLGKTIEAGMILKEISKREEIEITFIVVPSSLTIKWKQEMLMRFGEEFEIQKVNQFRAFLKEYKAYSNSRVFTKKIILSYHTLRDDEVIELLKDTTLHIDVLIMDEAHTFRNSDTSTFESAALITGLAEHIMFLSATPVQNKISDLFNILSLLDEDNFLDIDHFMKTIRPNRLIHQIIAYLKNRKSLVEIKDLIQENDLESLDMNKYQNELFQRFMLEESLIQEVRVDYIKQFTDADNLSYIINRTKKKDVGMFIPREAVSHTIPGTEVECAFYEEVVDFVKLLFLYKNPKIPSGFITIMPERMASSCMLASIESFEIMRKTKKFLVGDVDDQDDELIDVDIEEVLLDKLDVLIAKGKLIGQKDSKYTAFENTVDNLISENIKKMIVFSFFKKTLSYLENKLLQKGLRVGKIDGDLTPEERFEKINDFRENKFDILLSSEVGSEGLDMQFCNVVVNYDLPWNPMRVEQRIGRIDRIGQTADKLLIFNLCIEGTIEDRILNRLYSKLDIFESSIGELEPILGDIQTTFDIQKMIDLSEDESKIKVDLKAQSLIRQKIDVAENNSAMDAMLNDDYDFDETYDEYINNDKDKFVQKGSEKLFLDFLKKEGINFIAFKNNIFRLNKEDSKQLFEVLKPKMIEPKEKIIHMQQKRILNKLRKARFFHLTFSKDDSHDFDTEYLSLSHPLIKMISEKQNSISYAKVQSDHIPKGYAVVYREETIALKKTSTLKTLIFDKDLRLVNSPDYYTFVLQCQNSISEASVDLLQGKTAEIELHIIEKLNLNLAEKKEATARLIDQKIMAIKEHYEKKRKHAEHMKTKVSDLDVIRMRRAQVDNINQYEINKIEILEKQKKVTGNYTILAVMEISDE